MGSVQFSMFSATLPVQGEKALEGMGTDESGAACQQNA